MPTRYRIDLARPVPVPTEWLAAVVAQRLDDTANGPSISPHHTPPGTQVVPPWTLRPCRADDDAVFFEINVIDDSPILAGRFTLFSEDALAGRLRVGNAKAGWTSLDVVAVTATATFDWQLLDRVGPVVAVHFRAVSPIVRESPIEGRHILTSARSWANRYGNNAVAFDASALGDELRLTGGVASRRKRYHSLSGEFCLRLQANNPSTSYALAQLSVAAEFTGVGQKTRQGFGALDIIDVERPEP